MVLADLEKIFKTLTDAPLKLTNQLNNQSSKAILKRKKRYNFLCYEIFLL